jgi:hypothetical protein
MRSRNVRMTATVCEPSAHQSLVEAGIQLDEQGGQKPGQGCVQDAIPKIV